MIVPKWKRSFDQYVGREMESHQYSGISLHFLSHFPMTKKPVTTIQMSFEGYFCFLYSFWIVNKWTFTPHSFASYFWINLNIMSFLVMYVATISLFFILTKQGENNFCFKGLESVYAAFYGTYTLSSDYSTLSSSIKAILYNVENSEWALF